MTENGAPIYCGFNHFRGEAIFTSTLNTCYFEDKTLVKVKGGGLNGSNYKCSNTGEFYSLVRWINPLHYYCIIGLENLNYF